MLNLISFLPLLLVFFTNNDIGRYMIANNLQLMSAAAGSYFVSVSGDGRTLYRRQLAVQP